MSGALTTLRPGDRVGDYTIERSLASGAMGAVYVARLRDLEARHALKLVKLTARGGETAWARFEREARALAKLDHPGVVRVHAFGRAGDAGYLAMDLVDGPTLEVLIQESRLDERQSLELGVALGRTLAHLHEHGVIHRDVKPANVIVRRHDGQPVLCDFGLARGDGDQRLTQSQQLIGTPAFMAPEQIAGDRQLHGPPTDVFALGATLYMLLTGRPPFDAEDLMTLANRIVSSTPAAPRARTRGVDRVVLKALTKSPDERPSATWVADSLESALRGGRSSRAGRFGLVSGTLVGLAVGGVGLFYSAAPDALPSVEQPAAPANPHTAALVADAAQGPRALAEEAIGAGDGAAALAAIASAQALAPVDAPELRLLRARARLLVGELDAARADLPASDRVLLGVEAERLAIEDVLRKHLGRHDVWKAQFEPAQRLCAAAEPLHGSALAIAIRRRVQGTLIDYVLGGPRRVLRERQDAALRLLERARPLGDESRPRIARAVALFFLAGNGFHELEGEALEIANAVADDGLADRWRLDLLGIRVCGRGAGFLEAMATAPAQLDAIPVERWSWAEVHLQRRLSSRLSHEAMQVLNESLALGDATRALLERCIRWRRFELAIGTRRARADSWRLTGELLALAELCLYTRDSEGALEYVARVQRPDERGASRLKLIVAECALERGDFAEAGAALEGLESPGALTLRARLVAAQGRRDRSELYLTEARARRGAYYYVPWRRPELTQRILNGDDPRASLVR